MRRRLRVAAALVAASALVLAAGAGADTVTSSVSSLQLAPGESGSVSYSVHGNSSDGVHGCNFNGTNSVTVSLSADPALQLSSTSLTFTTCDAPQTVTVTAPAGTAAGTYNITASASDAAVDASPAAVSVTVVTPTADTTAPVLSLPGNLTVAATSAAGAVVTYSASAVDNIDGAVTVSCTPPSGSTFPVGTTTVNCSAQDAAGNSASGSFTVTVNPQPPADTVPPEVTVPSSPITVGATNSAGAVVTFSASANDAVSGALTPTCTPGSGSTFPIGTTVVTCTATDTAGNTGSATFSVNVTDTAAPVVSVPSPITVVATGPAGAVVTFSASASDAVAGAITANCTPASGSTFRVGTTVVTCTATDTAGNTGSATFSVVVTDAGPAVVVPPTQTVEASGPTGSRVTYTPTPTASDVVDGPLPVSCTPASGALFPVGTTTVNCTAVDSSGASASASFLVAVVDTTPPVVTAPPPATFVSESGGPLPRSTSALAAYLSRGRATDLVTLEPILHVDAPERFPLGQTVVRYIAIDGSGNRAEDTTTITVIPPPPPGQPRPTLPPDDPPPGNVTGLRVVRGNGLLRLSWTAPRDPDVARYAAFRSERTGPLVQVYSGAATSFTDRGLVNGVEYRYVVVAFDRAGNRSVGVAVMGTPRMPMLLAPRDGARLARGTVFSWRRAPGARYYNFQLFVQRPGAVGAAPRLQKVLSAWPVTNRFRLGAKWKFGRRTFRLVPGTYRWFVWPGFGARRDARYGELLGERSFVVVRRRR